MKSKYLTFYLSKPKLNSNLCHISECFNIWNLIRLTVAYLTGRGGGGGLVGGWHFRQLPQQQQQHLSQDHVAETEEELDSSDEEQQLLYLDEQREKRRRRNRDRTSADNLWQKLVVQVSFTIQIIQTQMLTGEKGVNLKLMPLSKKVFDQYK